MASATNERWGVVGHEWAVATLSHHISATRVHHAYLFTGVSAIGKRTLAVAFARAMLCKQQNSPCTAPNLCRVCVLVSTGKHPDVFMLAPAISGKFVDSAKIGIKPIRRLVRQFSLRPVESDRRLAIVTDFEAAGPMASDALLKTLEEPPGNGVVVLTADSCADLKPAIASRCAQVALRPLPRNLIKHLLSKRWGASPERADVLARLSNGRLGWAVSLLKDDSPLDTRSVRLSELHTLLSAGRVERFAYADGLSKNRGELSSTLELWECWWRDVMHVAAGANTSITNADRHEDVVLVADSLTVREAARAVSSVRTAQTSMVHNANARMVLEVLLLDLPRISIG